MIVFDLHCGHGHAFEGWFGSGDEFLRQQASSMVRCPVCDDAAVERLPSAKVRVRKYGSETTPRAVKPPSPPKQDAVAGFPPELVAKLREVVRNTEDVGERFAEEARKIHYEETPARAIRGQASSDDAQALTEEGIEFSSLPAFLTRESH